jgi:hypothetical protein
MMKATLLARALVLPSVLGLLGACAGSNSNDSDVDDWAGSGKGGTGGSTGGGTSGGSGGSGATGGSGAVPSTGGELGSGTFAGVGSSMDRYYTASVKRNGIPYYLITNGWGPGFQSQSISWHGTSFTVVSMAGTQGMNYEPASYPSVFCGKYSVDQVPACGLPATVSSLTAVKTGWRWKANGNAGAYNSAYDIWLGDGSQLQSYLMVWLRDPPGPRPAGALMTSNIAVANVPGTWNLWTGSVNGRPIVNYVRPEGTDLLELEFDVLDFVRDAKTRMLNLPGTHINSVAIGFEIWSGPVSNLATEDFYVHVD